MGFNSNNVDRYFCEYHVGNWSGDRFEMMPRFKIVDKISSIIQFKSLIWEVD